MAEFQALDPFWISALLLALNAAFAVAWGLDARTHARLQSVDITDRELHVHRLILLPSLAMELALVAMLFNRWLALPFFLAFYGVRTAHEFIDELRFHVDRCTPTESLYHLAMWCLVHTKTWLFFGWGFLLGFKGLLDLPIWMLAAHVAVLGVLGTITLAELRRGLPWLGGGHGVPDQRVDPLRPSRKEVA